MCSTGECYLPTVSNGIEALLTRFAKPGNMTYPTYLMSMDYFLSGLEAITRPPHYPSTMGDGVADTDYEEPLPIAA